MSERVPISFSVRVSLLAIRNFGDNVEPYPEATAYIAAKRERHRRAGWTDDRRAHTDIKTGLARQVAENLGTYKKLSDLTASLLIKHGFGVHVAQNRKSFVKLSIETKAALKPFESAETK